MAKLKAMQVKNLQAPGRYSDGTAGLHLFVQKSGSKSWVQRIMVDGTRKDIGLGAYPAVSLAQARNLALDNKERIRKGKAVETARTTPAKETVGPKAKDTGPTFSDLATTYQTLNGRQWSKSHNRLVQSIMSRYILPAFGDKPIKSVSRQDVVGLLETLLADIPATAQKVRAAISGVLGYAVIKGLIAENHAGPVVDPLMKGAGKVKEHQRALEYNRVADVLAIIDHSTASASIKLGFRFLVLTAARTSEIRYAEWTEINWTDRTWTVPANKMKSRREHRQPLTAAAMDVLREAWAMSDGSPYIFPGRIGENRPMTQSSFREWMRKLELPASPHGFRASFRTWAQNATDATYEVAEGCLSHSYGDATVLAYARGDMLEKRRELLEDWAMYLESSLTVA